MSLPLEHDYIGLSEKIVSCCCEEEDDKNLKRTELRLGLPGSESPERSAGLEDKNGFSLRVLKSLVSGAKRGFSDAIDDSGKWGFSGNGGGKPVLDGFEVSAIKNGVPPSSNVKSLPAKSQVVGWPPIRSFRKNTMASAIPPKNYPDKSVPDCLYVKVSMDGAPYLRKLDLKTYSNYMELSAALDNMFSSFTVGQCGAEDKDGVSESRLKDLLHASECALTYEDKDGDWMLVGDVPWNMFINSCKRLRIMKGSEAIGLAPRAMEKCRNMN